MLASQFGTLIRDLRARSCLTQEGLARAAKVSRTVLSRLGQGTAIAVQTDVLDRVLAALGASPTDTYFTSPRTWRQLFGS